jgi:hypothetical protein
MKYATTALLVLCLAGAPVMFGCDREVSHQDSQQTNPDGTVTKTQTTTSVDSNGNTVKSTDVSRSNP